MEESRIGALKAFEIGHAQDYEAMTGCTVILCRNGAVGGVDVRGGAPGTRETDLLNPVNLVDRIHAVVLTGGSAFGLEASCGVMDYLEECGVGFDTGIARVPIVCSAVLFDLNIGNSRIRPDKAMGRSACVNVTPDPVEGNAGAGTGATVGKLLGPDFAMKGGLGICCLKAGDLLVGAVVAVNCLGDVIDPSSGKILAGAYDRISGRFLDSVSLLVSNAGKGNCPFPSNTSIGCVITNAALTKAQANKVASMAHDGYARTVRPVHTMYDGDTIFAMASCEVESDVNAVGALASIAVEKAVIRGVKSAWTASGYPGLREKSGMDISLQKNE